MPEYRARFDADVTFTNDGDLSARGFMLDIPGPVIETDDLAQRFLASLGLLMAGTVAVLNIEIVEASHLGSRGGPSEHQPAERGRDVDATHTLVELSHVIRAGMITYPGLPAPTITPFLTREQSRANYAPGTEFALDCITLIGNTGTYLDSPYHRFAGATDLAELSLSRTADLPTVVVRVTDSVERGISARTFAAIDPDALNGAAVLLHTGDDAHFGLPEYAIDASYLTADGAKWLVDHQAALVGIDSVNIDQISDTARPAHSRLLAAGIPIVEHLTGLDQLPLSGVRFTAVAPRVAEFGTFPVRAFATIPAGLTRR